MTTAQKKFAYGLLARKGLREQKEDIVLELTEGRTSHFSDMTKAEVAAFFRLMGAEDKDDARQKMQRKLLSLAHEMQWHNADGQLNYERLDAWCIKYTPAHKPFRAMSAKELSTAITIFGKMYVQTLTKV